MIDLIFVQFAVKQDDKPEGEPLTSYCTSLGSLEHGMYAFDFDFNFCWIDGFSFKVIDISPFMMRSCCSIYSRRSLFESRSGMSNVRSLISIHIFGPSVFLRNHTCPFDEKSILQITSDTSRTTPAPTKIGRISATTLRMQCSQRHDK
jgi:hypothetical protein